MIGLDTLFLKGVVRLAAVNGPSSLFRRHLRLNLLKFDDFDMGNKTY